MQVIGSDYPRRHELLGVWFSGIRAAGAEVKGFRARGFICIRVWKGGWKLCVCDFLRHSDSGDGTRVTGDIRSCSETGQWDNSNSVGESDLRG
jgi:hypothetical protein